MPESESPRWDVIDKLYNEMDEIITKYITKEECVFIEIDIAMMMVKEKLRQNKTNLYLQFLNEEQNKDTSGVYG
jgi:hypothetical protein